MRWAKYTPIGPACLFHLDLSQTPWLIIFSLYSGRHLYTPNDNKCYKHIYPDIFCAQLQGELPNAATLYADANVEGFRDANLLGTSEAFNHDFGLDSSLANPASPSPNSNPGSSNLFENSNQLVVPNSMQPSLISDGNVVMPSQAAANNPVIPDSGSLLGGTNWDFSGSGNSAQGGASNNQNPLPNINIDTSVQEAAHVVPGGSDQSGGDSFGNISPPDQANNLLQYVPDLNVQALG